MPRLRLSLSLVLAAAILQGCVSVRTQHGYALERGERELSGQVGVDTKDSILAKYGEPSLIGTFERDRWYYMASTDAARAFFKPETQTRAVVAFHFDDKGYVQEVRRLDLDDGMKVNLVSRETPTRGKELGFWEQLLGNVGQLPAPGAGQQEPGY